jgi:cell division protein FtsX
VVVGLLVGHLLARGTLAWRRRRVRAARGRQPEVAAGVAETEIVAVLVALVLLGWLVAWLVTLVV